MCSTNHNNVSQIGRKRRPKGRAKTTCSKCGKEVEESRKGQRYCLGCHNEYMRANRKRHSELTEEQRKRANCRSYLNQYIRSGKIKKQPCVVCGLENSEAHHEDYSKPLEVMWFCRKHHLEYHKTNKIMFPDQNFLDNFKSVKGALSITESIAIMNIANQAVPGLWVEGGTHLGKSAMSAIYGAKQAPDFHLIDTEFEKTISTQQVADNISKISNIGARLTFIVGSFLEYIKGTDFRFSFVFSDAGAHDDEVMIECQLLEDRMVPGGIICFHDYKNQFTAVERAYDYLLSTGKFEEVKIDWDHIIEYVVKNNLENGNCSWHSYPDLPHPPNFVGALIKK